MPDIDDTEREKYEEQLDDLSEKDLLVHILVELQTIRWQNEQALGMGREKEEKQTEGGEPGLYQCNLCDDKVRESELESHAKTAHNWHSGLGLESVYDLNERSTDDE